MKTKYILLFMVAAATLHGPCRAEVERIFRPPSYTRGNAGLTVRYDIERASWIAHPAAHDEGGGLFVKYRRAFRTGNREPFEIDVSGDGRFTLLLDGKVISRGPHRGLVENWQFQSYRLALEEGEHLLEAVVWSAGEKAPRAQLEHRHGFVLKASGAYDDLLTTGKAAWEAGILRGTRFTAQGWSGAFGTGWETCANGTGFLEAQPEKWEKACISEAPQGESIGGGVRRKGRLLYPSQLPDQLNRAIRPGEVVDGGTLCGIVPKNAKRRLLWDLGDYYCAYPVLKVSGGAGATIRWGWAESLRGADGAKGNRNEWRGKKFNGFGDKFVCDGRRDAVFTAPWMRCGRWCELLVETADEPLEIQEAFIEETRYPLEWEWSFECSDPSVTDVLSICRRGMEECTHEMLFDCPFYEQQMYPGDGRVELQVLTAGSRDRRIAQRVVELFDFARRNDGFVPMNFPCWLQQESGTYTMCYAMMYGDLARWGVDATWLSARRPGLRHTMGALQRHENAEGLLTDLPGWPFVDWVPEWNHGEAPDGRAPGCANAIHSLFWVLAMQSAAATERRCGDEAQAEYWLARARRTFDAVHRRFWDEGRGLFADDLAHGKWSEHAQALAIVTGLMSAGEEKRAFEGLISSPELARTTVYFSHYLFEAYFRHGRGDLFLKKLDLWRDYVRLGLKTPLESPGANARSDCHAWGAHPIYHALSGLAGIRPAALDYSKVVVAPCPGGLSFIRAHAPHPQGEVVIDLRFDGTGVSGTVTLPHDVDGIFKWGGVERPLAPEGNKIEMKGKSK